jgi:hypothetical protein
VDGTTATCVTPASTLLLLLHMQARQHNFCFQKKKTSGELQTKARGCTAAQMINALTQGGLGWAGPGFYAVESLLQRRGVLK